MLDVGPNNPQPGYDGAATSPLLTPLILLAPITSALHSSLPLVPSCALPSPPLSNRPKREEFRGCLKRSRGLGEVESDEETEVVPEVAVQGVVVDRGTRAVDDRAAEVQLNALDVVRCVRGGDEAISVGRLIATLRVHLVAVS